MLRYLVFIFGFWGFFLTAFYLWPLWSLALFCLVSYCFVYNALRKDQIPLAEHIGKFACFILSPVIFLAILISLTFAPPII